MHKQVKCAAISREKPKYFVRSEPGISVRRIPDYRADQRVQLCRKWSTGILVGEGEID